MAVARCHLNTGLNHKKVINLFIM